MSDTSRIEWTDATWNPVRGCVKVSPGCAHCYAETFAERFRGVPGHPYEQGFDLRLVPEKLTEPLRWKTPRRVFVNSMSDLFQDGVPWSFLDQALAVMALTPQHTYQILTKRSAEMRDYIASPDRSDAILDEATDIAHDHIANTAYLQDTAETSIGRWPLPNVWLGVSVENQRWKTRIDELRETPAAVHFLSIEPLLEDVGPLDLRGIQWCIVGGESGPGARPMDLAWARSIVSQCKAAGVAVFVKQLGAKPRGLQWGSVASGRLYPGLHDKKGGDMAEWPEDLRVREFPA